MKCLLATRIDSFRALKYLVHEIVKALIASEPSSSKLSNTRALSILELSISSISKVSELSQNYQEIGIVRAFNLRVPNLEISGSERQIFQSQSCQHFQFFQTQRSQSQSSQRTRAPKQLQSIVRASKQPQSFRATKELQSSLEASKQ